MISWGQCWKWRDFCMRFLPLKFSHYPSRPVPVPELFCKYLTRTVPKSKTSTRRTLTTKHTNTTNRSNHHSIKQQQDLDLAWTAKLVQYMGICGFSLVALQWYQGSYFTLLGATVTQPSRAPPPLYQRPTRPIFWALVHLLHICIRCKTQCALAQKMSKKFNPSCGDIYDVHK